MSTQPKAPPVDDIGGLAFWIRPDWSGGDNLRDPGTEPFWMRSPELHGVVGRNLPGRSYSSVPVFYGVERSRGNRISYYSDGECGAVRAAMEAHASTPFHDPWERAKIEAVERALNR